MLWHLSCMRAVICCDGTAANCFHRQVSRDFDSCLPLFFSSKGLTEMLLMLCTGPSGCGWSSQTAIFAQPYVECKLRMLGYVLSVWRKDGECVLLFVVFPILFQTVRRETIRLYQCCDWQQLGQHQQRSAISVNCTTNCSKDELKLSLNLSNGRVKTKQMDLKAWMTPEQLIFSAELPFR